MGFFGGLFIGLFVGLLFGVVIVSILAVGAASERDMETIFNHREKVNNASIKK